ncbi:hypothetical protein BC831DRAFT_460970 [Entophlyctis helioformis]|nr:hypothetical protein BC831DRAFT_460970 [Entophlyctis helioformis]
MRPDPHKARATRRWKGKHGLSTTPAGNAGASDSATPTPSSSTADGAAVTSTQSQQQHRGRGGGGSYRGNGSRRGGAGHDGEDAGFGRRALTSNHFRYSRDDDAVQAPTAVTKAGSGTGADATPQPIDADTAELMDLVQAAATSDSAPTSSFQFASERVTAEFFAESVFAVDWQLIRSQLSALWQTIDESGDVSAGSDQLGIHGMRVPVWHPSRQQSHNEQRVDAHLDLDARAWTHVFEPLPPLLDSHHDRQTPPVSHETAGGGLDIGPDASEKPAVDDIDLDYHDHSLPAAATKQPPQLAIVPSNEDDDEDILGPATGSLLTSPSRPQLVRHLAHLSKPKASDSHPADDLFGDLETEPSHSESRSAQARAANQVPKRSKSKSPARAAKPAAVASKPKPKPATANNDNIDDWLDDILG